MSARTNFRRWEYRKIDDALLRLALDNFPIICITDSNTKMSDSDSEVIVNVKCHYCKKCEQVFDNIDQFMLHEIQCGKEVLVPCPECNREYSNFNNMMRHWRKFHAGKGKEEPRNSARLSFDKSFQFDPVQSKSANLTSDNVRSKNVSFSDEVKDLTISCVEHTQENKHIKGEQSGSLDHETISQKDTRQQKHRQIDLGDKSTGTKRKSFTVGMDDDNKNPTNKDGRKSVTTLLPVSGHDSIMNTPKTRQSHNDNITTKSNKKGSLETSFSKRGNTETNSSQKGSIETNSSNKVNMKTNSCKKECKEANSSKKGSVETNSSKKGSVETNSSKKGSVETNSSKKGSVETNSSKKGSAEAKSSKKENKETDLSQKASMEPNFSKEGSVETYSNKNRNVETNSAKKGSLEKNSSQKDSKETNSCKKSNETKSSKKGNKQTDSRKKGSLTQISKKGKIETETSTKRFKQRSLKDMLMAETVKSNKKTRMNELDSDDKKDVLMTQINVELNTRRKSTDQENANKCSDTCTNIPVSEEMKNSNHKNERIFSDMKESEDESDQSQECSQTVGRTPKQMFKSEFGCKFSCKCCSKIFKTNEKYEKHYRATHYSHLNSDKLESESSELGKGKQLGTDMKNTDNKNIICPVCNKELTGNLGRHLLVHEKIPQPLPVCLVCGLKITVPSNFTRHMLIHMESYKYRCNLCDAVFKRSDNLKEHNAFVHTDENTCKIKCPICGKKKRNKFDLTRHMVVHEKDPIDPVCKICGKTFTQMSKLNRHLPIHKFRCRSCKIDFRKKDRLTGHIAAIHGGRRKKKNETVLGKKQKVALKTSKDKVILENPIKDEKLPSNQEEINQPGIDEPVFPCILKTGYGGRSNSTERKLKTGVCKSKLKKSKGYAFATSYKLKNKYNNNNKRPKRSATLLKNSEIQDVLETEDEIQDVLETGGEIQDVLKTGGEIQDVLEQSKAFPCFICDTGYQYRRGLLRHFKRYHRGHELPKRSYFYNDNKITCLYCNTDCNDYIELQSHFKEKHKSIRTLYIEEVKKTRQRRKTDASSSMKEEKHSMSGNDETKNINNLTSGVKKTIALKNLKILVKKYAPIPPIENYIASEDMDTSEVDQNDHNLSGQKIPVQSTPLTRVVKDSLHERLYIPLSGPPHPVGKKPNYDFQNFKITLQPSNQRVVCKLPDNTVEEVKKHSDPEITESVIENEKESRTVKSKEKSKHKRRSDIETHVMEPLGTQPEDVEPVGLLGKSCVSINSPKISRQLSKPHGNEEIPQRVGSPDSKMSKISRESLTKRFERSQSENKKISDVGKNAGEKSVNLNTDEVWDNTDINNQQLSSTQHQSENKQNATKVKKSPKVLLERLPALSERETTVNINELMFQEPRNKKKSINFFDTEKKTDSYLDNNTEEESCESAEEDEDESAIIVQKLADLKKIISSRRSKRFGGCKESKKTKRGDKDSNKYVLDKQNCIKVVPESSDINIYFAKSNSTENVENDENQKELSSEKSEQVLLCDVYIDKVKSRQVNEISKPESEKLSDTFNDNAMSTEIYLPVCDRDLPVCDRDLPVGDSDLPVANSDLPVGDSDLTVANSDLHVGNSSNILEVVKDIGDMDETDPDGGGELQIDNSEQKKNQDVNLNRGNHVRAKRKKGVRKGRSKGNRQSLSEVDSLVQSEQLTDFNMEKHIHEDNRKEIIEKELENLDIIEKGDKIVHLEQDTLKECEDIMDTTGNVVDERIDATNTARNVVDDTAVNVADVRIDTTECTAKSNNKQFVDESMDDKILDERGDHEKKDMSEDKGDNNEGKGDINKGKESQEVYRENIDMDSEMGDVRIPVGDEAMVDDNSGLTNDKKTKEIMKENNKRKRSLKKLPSVKKREQLPRSKKQMLTVSYNDFLMESNQNVMAAIADNDDSAQSKAPDMDTRLNDRLSADMETDVVEREQTSMDLMQQDITSDSAENIGINLSTALEGNKSDNSENHTVLPENFYDKLSNESNEDNLKVSSTEKGKPDDLQENSIESSDNPKGSSMETPNETEENNFSEKETFKVLKLNWNPCFSDKKLVPLEAEGQDESENLASFPKIIRYINESPSSEKSRENGLSSCNALDEIMPNMLKLLAKDGNGDLDLNGVFDDITVENSQDCYEIDYAPTERTKHFLSLEHLLSENINPCYICDYCDELFQCFEKYDDHKKNQQCSSVIERNTLASSSFSDCTVDSLYGENQNSDKKFACHLCGLKYKLKANLLRHKKKAHHANETRTDKLEKLKIKIQNLNKTINSEKKKVLHENVLPCSQSSEITDGEFCSISESDSLVQYFAEPITACEYSDDKKLVDTEMDTEETDNNHSTLVNLSAQSTSEKDGSSSLYTKNGNSAHDTSSSSTIGINITSIKHSVFKNNDETPLQRNNSVVTSSDCDTTINRTDETCFKSDTDLEASRLNESMLNQSLEESHPCSSSLDNTLKYEDMLIAKTPNQFSEITNKHLESTPINKDGKKTPEQNLFEEEALLHSPSRKLDFTEDDGATIGKIFTLDEIKLKYHILLECKVLLENISLEGETVCVGDLTLRKVGKCRWKITSGGQKLTFHGSDLDERTNDSEICNPVIASNTMNLIDQSNSIVTTTNDFDVNCPTYEIEYFPSSSQLDLDQNSDNSSQTNQSSSFLSQLDNISTGQSKLLSKNKSESESSSVHSHQNEVRKHKVKQRKEKEIRTNSSQLSPKKNLTEFEKAITKPQEARKKRKLERNNSKFEDSNSHDGLDFLKKANERTASNSERDISCFSSKLAQSIINKKAKQKAQENLNITPCALEDIEPFETVLASKDSVKKSPLKKKKKTYKSVSSDQSIMSKSLIQSVLNDSQQYNPSSLREERFPNAGEIITETVIEEVIIEDPNIMFHSNTGALETSEISTIDVSSSLFSKPNEVPTKNKQKSLSDRFGALEKSKSVVEKPSKKDLKNLSSGDVMKSMFGTGVAKFDRTFRKQPGEENQNTCMKLKSPLESVERNDKTKFGACPVSSDMKQTIVISTEKKQPPNTKRHLLNMLKDLMDSPEEKRFTGNVSLRSPKDTGIFSDTRSVKTVINTQNTSDNLNLSGMQSTDNTMEKSGVVSPARSVQISNLSDRSSEKSDLSVSTRDITGKNIVPPGHKTAEKQDVLNDNNSDISRASNASICSSGVKFGRKRSGSETGGQPRKKPKIQRMPVTEDKMISEKTSISHEEETKSNASSRGSKIVSLPMPVHSAEDLKQSPYQTGEEKEIETEEEETDSLEQVKDTIATDHISNHESDEIQNENLISELEPEIQPSKNTSVAYNSTFNFSNVKQAKLNIALSPIRSQEFEGFEQSDGENEIDTENHYNRENDNKGIDEREDEKSSYDDERSNMDVDESNDISDGEIQESDNENPEIDDENEESVNENEESDDENQKSDIEKSGDESDESDKEDSINDKSANEESESSSSDDEVCNDKEENKSESEEDIFSTKKFKAIQSGVSDYFEDDAISVIVDYEYETASFLIAAPDEEEERMTAVDNELSMINGVDGMKCDEEMNKPDIAADAQNSGPNSNMADITTETQWFADYKGPYPPGYCFRFLNQKRCLKNGCSFKHHIPSPVELYRSCVKGIAEACGKGDAKRAFDIYNNLLQTKAGLTPRDTLSQLLKVAENNWNVISAFSLLDDLNQQNMVSTEVCEVLIRLCGQRPAYFSQHLWKLFEIILKSQRIHLTADSISVLLRSFSHLQDLTYLWHVIVHAKQCKIRTVPAELLYSVLSSSLVNPDPYYQHIEKWVQLCEPHLLQQLNQELRSGLICLFHSRRQIGCVRKLEESARYANFEQSFNECNEHQDSLHQGNPVVLHDSMKTTDNYKALYHKIQSCYHTKNWGLLGETFVELCQQGELNNSYYIDAYAVVLLTNVKNPTLLVDAFNKFMNSLSRQYQEESQEDVLAKFDSRSLAYIGNRLLYQCRDKQWWKEGHNLMKIMVKYSVPFYRHTEEGKQLSAVTAINICLNAKDVVMAYSIHMNFGWDTQVLPGLPELKCEITVLHDLFDQLLLYPKPREALRVLGSCLDIIESNTELNDYFDFIEDFNRLIISALDCGDFYAGCWAFKLHSSAQVSKDLDKRTLRCLLTACGENDYIKEAKELHKICKTKGVYPVQSIESPRTIYLTTAMTYIELKLEIESYLEWVYRFLCEIQLEGHILDISHFFVHVNIERIIDPVAFKMPYICRVPRSETAAYNMVLQLFKEEFAMEGKISYENNAWFIYLKVEHVRKYLEKLDSQALRQGFRVRGYNRT